MRLLLILILFISSAFDSCYADITPPAFAGAVKAELAQECQPDFAMEQCSFETPDGRDQGIDHDQSMCHQCHSCELWTTGRTASLPGWLEADSGSTPYLFNVPSFYANSLKRPPKSIV